MGKSRRERRQNRKIIFNRRARECNLHSASLQLVDGVVESERNCCPYPDNDNLSAQVDVSLCSSGTLVSTASDLSYTPLANDSDRLQTSPIILSEHVEISAQIEFANGVSKRPSEKAIRLATLASRHNLTDVCMQDILKLLIEEKVSTEPPIKNLYQLDRQIGISSLKSEFMWRCAVCLQTVRKSLFDTPYSATCCGKPFSENCDHFVLFNCKEQIELALRGATLRPGKFGKFEELKSSGTCSDNDVFVSLNTDGTPIFSSSKSSLWPMLASINNISCAESKNRIIILGVWVANGGRKPDFSWLLEHFVADLKEALATSLHWTDMDGNDRISNIFVSNVLCDSMARPAVQMMNQFNAEFGCGFCYHKEKGHYFSYRPFRTRSHNEHVENSSRAVDTYGVVGKSPFVEVDHLDIIWDFPMDVLHTTYLGVADHFTSLFFTCPKETVYHISPQLAASLDTSLLNIKPPDRVSRLPRSLKYRNNYKGHEWNMWFTYYSPVLLRNILPHAYYHNWLNLVNGVSLLNYSVSEITPTTITRAGLLLEDFCRRVPELYGEKSNRFNVHLLRHMEQCVRRHGPLHQFSMTVFESFNLVLKSYVTSSKGVGSQIAKRYLRDVMIRGVGVGATSCTDKTLSRLRMSRCIPYLQQLNLSLNESLKLYSGVVYNGTYFKSVSGTTSKKRINYFYWSTSDTVFEVEFYFKTEAELTVAVGTEYKLKQSAIPVDHIYEIAGSGVSTINVNELLGVVIKIENDGIVYFAKFINDVECYRE